MKAMLTAFAAIVLISAAAWYGLGSLGYSSGERMAGDAVRLGDERPE